MPNGTYGGVRGRKTKVGRKLLRFPPTRLSILTHCKYLLAYISDAPKRWKWSRVEQIPFPMRLEGHFRRKFHFQRDWKAISDGNSISNAVGSPLRGRNSISNVIGRPFPSEIPFPTRLEAFCADAMAFPTFLKGLRACHDSVTIL